MVNILFTVLLILNMVIFSGVPIWLNCVFCVFEQYFYIYTLIKEKVWIIQLPLIIYVTSTVYIHYLFTFSTFFFFLILLNSCYILHPNPHTLYTLLGCLETNFHWKSTLVIYLQTCWKYEANYSRQRYQATLMWLSIHLHFMSF